jgi:soluble lytic murein transglycosylase-like protein
MPGWTEVQSVVALKPPPDSTVHLGLGQVGKPRLDVFAAQFRAAARRTGVEDAWLRAIAHAESGYDPRAISPKGAQGLMQLMPAVARELGVRDPFAASDSIRAGARHLRRLLQRYGGDYTRAAAAYNAGMGAVARYGGVPPYRETQAYVEKVARLHTRYRAALGQLPVDALNER